MTPAHPQSQPYAYELALMKQLLSRHNPASFYSKKEISAYVAKHFHYVNPDGTPETPSPGMVDWSEKEKAAARVISHLPRYAQILLIETGCDLRLYPNTEKVGVAYKRAIEGITKTHTDKTGAGFYNPKDNAIHWAMGNDYYTKNFLHEIGHAIDCSPKKQFHANDAQFNFAPHIQHYLGRKHGIVSDLYTHIKGGDLAYHFKIGEYNEAALPIETAAELFAERTILRWQHQRSPQQVDITMADKYPEIWPTMHEKYLPFLEQKADKLHAQNHHRPFPTGSNPWHTVDEAVDQGRLQLAAEHGKY